MNFWNNIVRSSGMGGMLIWLTLAFLFSCAVLAYLFPRERTRLKTAVILLALSLAGLFFAAIAVSQGYGEQGAAYRWIHWASNLLLGIAIVNLASVLLFDLALSNIHFSVPRILRDLIVAGTYIILAIYLLTRHGVDVTGVIATSTVITAIIGLSFQDTLGNIMGGLALQMEKTITEGDWIKIDQVEGRVKEIRWRFTAIETRNWDTVVVPNSALMKGQVTLLGRRDGKPLQHRQWVHFNVDFRYPPPLVIDSVITALCADPISNVAADPKPDCILENYRESYATYAVRYWLTNFAVDAPTDSLIRERIYFALRRSNISLSIPAHALFITEDDATRKQGKALEELQGRIDSLRKVELFHSLTQQELETLAHRLTVAPFLRGEAITRQGAEAHWLYIIITGTVEVRVMVESTGLSSKVTELYAGDYFGEGGMLTGERRTATVLALTDVECYRLDKHAFTDIITQRKEIAQDVSEVMARRRVELEAIREDLDEEAMKARLHERKSDILHRILDFFSAEKV